MTFKDIMTKKTYEKNGEQKATWLKCGTIRITDDGKQFIELNHLPGITFFVFDQKERKGAPKPNNPDQIEWAE